ncbi:NYN domain-containing protein [Roridomyces roridus]|uniref:NYN domain-containing protein n=1 Tax=Roridomyces roridus TaxID=1738132 RepID=A0AAD7FM66_9AGAR|nr:NYN domain-containing protein [Roridomyces roridus]
MQSNNVAVFWDYENCHSASQTSGYEVVNGIRTVALKFGSVKYFKAYMEMPDSDTPRSLSLRSELQSSGVSLTDCPHNGRKNVADQMIIVDMMAYAMDHPAPATLILISGDRDFAYAVAILRLRGYEVVLISLAAHISLKSQASVCLDWNALFPNARYTEPVSATPSPRVRRSSYFGDRLDENPSSSEAASAKDVHPRGSCVPAPAYSVPATPKRNVAAPTDHPDAATTEVPFSLPVLRPETPPLAGPSQLQPSGDHPPHFKVLIDILEKYRAKGVEKPLRSTVGVDLAGQTVYKDAGAKNFSQFIALAEQAKVVQLGGTSGSAWIALHRSLQ